MQSTHFFVWRMTVCQSADTTCHEFCSPFCCYYRRCAHWGEILAKRIQSQSIVCRLVCIVLACTFSVSIRLYLLQSCLAALCSDSMSPPPALSCMQPEKPHGCHALLQAGGLGQVHPKAGPQGGRGGCSGPHSVYPAGAWQGSAACCGSCAPQQSAAPRPHP